MKLTANQTLQLLWIHHHEPAHDIGLTVQDVVDLELTLVNQYSELIPSDYVKRMIPQTKDTLAEHFMHHSNTTFFNSEDITNASIT